ncbi:MAG: alpha/beta hydrolase [Candidatus Omnitrophota bacterium]
MTALISAFLILFVGLFCLIKFLERTAVFFPGKYIDSTPSHAGLSFEDLYLTTVDHIKINAWFVKASSDASTIIFAHGNAGTMSDRVMRIKFLHDLGFNVLIFDYRGYGRSQGEPTEKGIYLDAQAAYDYLQTRMDINHERIIAYGASLGGVVMIDLATQKRFAALVVESSFTSAADMALRYYPLLPSFMLSIKLDSLSKINKITIPKLFLHSAEDQTVPFSMGQKLYTKAANPKSFLLIHGGHNDGALMSDTKAKESFLKFFKEYSL